MNRNSEIAHNIRRDIMFAGGPDKVIAVEMTSDFLNQVLDSSDKMVIYNVPVRINPYVKLPGYKVITREVK